MSSTLNILHICDHLGWEGSRMHGVKRLFSWIIPKFDDARFNVSLVSLRKKDLSEETLDALGIDITYLQRSKFDSDIRNRHQSHPKGNYNDFKYSTKSFFSCSVKLNFLKPL